MIQQLIGHVGQFGSAAYDYFSSGQAWDDVKSGADGVKKWFEDTFGGGGSAPGDPNNWNHRDFFLRQASNSELRNAISELYRSTATLGDGGTADMLRYEFDSGQALNHLQKANDMIKYLNNILINEFLTDAEIKLTYQLLNDLNNAVKYVGPQ